jgi:hypothetical protein
MTGEIAVFFHIPAPDDGMRAEAEGHFHGHGGMDPKSTGFITTCGYHSSVPTPAYQYGFSFQTAVFKALHGYEEAIHVYMSYGSLSIQ